MAAAVATPSGKRKRHAVPETPAAAAAEFLGRTVLVPAEVFPKEKPPKAGGWKAVVTAVNRSKPGTLFVKFPGAAELYYFPIEDVRSWLAPRPDADGKEKTRAAAAAARAAVEAPARPEDAALPSPAKSATAKARRSGAGKEQALGQSRAPGAETATKPRRAPAAPAGAAAPQRRQQQEQRESAAAGGVEHGGEELQAGQPGAAASGQQQQGAEGVGAGPEGEPAPAGISSGGEASILDESGEVGVEDSGDSGAGASEGEELLPAKGEEEVLDDRPAKRQRTQASSVLFGGLNLALGSAMTYALLMWLDHSGA